MNRAPREWLEPDGRGGFASGTEDLVRTRRYHALLLSADRAPSHRWLLVNGLEAWIEGPDGATRPLTAQQYQGAVNNPEGRDRIQAFSPDPWPTWTFELSEGSIEHELFVVPDARALTSPLALSDPRPGGPLTSLIWTGSAIRGTLKVRLLCSGRDPHQLHRESPAFQFGLSAEGHRLSFIAYPEVPAIHAWTNGSFELVPEWYRSFEYADEAARGLDHVEDLASPGVFSFDLAKGPAVLLLSAEPNALDTLNPQDQALALRDRERRRRQAFEEPLARSAEAYVVRTQRGHAVVAGYPWFGEWGRATFIALRGLRHLPHGQAYARSVLERWVDEVTDGLLPNRAPGRREALEYNAVDAPLWYILAVRDLIGAERVPADNLEHRLLESVAAILDGYRRGTRFGIAADRDGLLRAGVPGLQLTWMDAKVDDWVVTPRVGKPVEVQALWLSALDFAQRYFDRYRRLFETARSAFLDRFYHPDLGILRDVVDVDHVAGKVDDRLRPNQVLALGALPTRLIDRGRARSILEKVEAALWTPLGLRSLDPKEPGYRPTYQGDVRARDGAYHQGSVWPWLTGPFVDAWVDARGGGREAQVEARRKFLDPVLRNIHEAGLGHVSEIADGEAPHVVRGAPFHAATVTELFRLGRTLASHTS